MKKIAMSLSMTIPPFVFSLSRGSKKTCAHPSGHRSCLLVPTGRIAPDDGL